MRWSSRWMVLGLLAMTSGSAQAQSVRRTVETPSAPTEIPVEVATTLPSRFVAPAASQPAPLESPGWEGVNRGAAALGVSSAATISGAFPSTWTASATRPMMAVIPGTEGEPASTASAVDLACDDAGLESCLSCGTTCVDSSGCCEACLPPCDGPVPFMLGSGTMGVPRVVFTGAQDLLIPAHLTNVADGNTARPVDRFSFTYRAQHNVPGALDATLFPLDAQPIVAEPNVHTYRLAAERTFLNGNVSMMLSAPMYSTVSRDLGLGVLEEGFEMGQLAFGPKLMLLEQNGWVVSTGIQFEAPTGRPLQLGGIELTTDREWYLSPFAAISKTHGRFFAQSFVSYRARTGAEELVLLPIPMITHDLLMADAQVGWWAMRRSGSGITGIAPMVELHYVGNTEREPDAFLSDQLYGSLDQLTLSGGLSMVLNERHTLAVGYGVPLRDNPTTAGVPTDRLFDGELTVQLHFLR